jgi:hypothetical protein
MSLSCRQSGPSSRFSIGTRIFVVILAKVGARMPSPWAFKIAPTVRVTDLTTSMRGRMLILMTMIASV